MTDTSLVAFPDAAAVAAHRSAVSLHAHTWHSREVMSNVSGYLERIPIVKSFVRRELRGYVRRNNAPVDFSKAWWNPPASPQDVWASEVTQIETLLGLEAFVSITDHDSIDAIAELRGDRRDVPVPVSFEWTVPFHEGFFHLGLHNLPPASATALFDALLAYQGAPDPSTLPELFERLSADPDTLVVMNHPFWDLAGIGSSGHVRLLRRFLDEHGRSIHALELNGYRSWQENRGVQALARVYPLPLISGGDRHGRVPNALVNLSRAASFGEFVREIRDGRSVVLVLPEYRKSLVGRKLATVADAIGHHAAYPAGRRRWADRVWYELDGVSQPLSAEWPDGGPAWVRTTINVFAMGTSRPLRPLFRALVWLAGSSQSVRPGPSVQFEAAHPAQASQAYREFSV